MTFRTLIRRSLRFHWRAHLGVVLGAAIGSAALIGALVVGDSVKLSLRQKALDRLAGAAVALNSGDRYFRSDLLERLGAVGSNQICLAASRGVTNGEVIWGSIAPQGKVALQLAANVSRLDGAARANHVQLFGVSDAELQYARSGRPVPSFEKAEPAPNGEVWVNDELARQLSLKAGDELLFRIQKPSALSTEATINPRNDSTIVARLRVAGVSRNPLSNLNLASGGAAPLNALVRLSDLGSMVRMEDRANLLLTMNAYRYKTQTAWDAFSSAYLFWKKGDSANPFINPIWWSRRGIKGAPVSSKETIRTIDSVVTQVWTMRDIQYDLTTRGNERPTTGPSNQSSFVELKTPRIFLDLPVTRAAMATKMEVQPVLVYLVNLLRSGTNTTPYSMVTAAGPPWTPADMRDDEILVSQWLADDLHVRPGDEISLVYFDPESGARLIEHTNTFRVRGVVPMEMPWADRSLMPDFPGIEKTESTSDWDAGFPLVHKIRDKDEEYWKQHRGTPKAFITLAAGQKMWANRFGDLTAIRFPIPTNALPLTPALSPGERENRSQSKNKPETGVILTNSEQSRTAQELSPLPGGEGQGEGAVSPSAGGTSFTSSQATDKDGEAVERVPTTVEVYCTALEKKILANLKPEELGLRFEPVREQALKAAEQSQDFGGLFLGFSFFLIIAALLLMAMLFQFGLEQRTSEIGTLLALGFTPRQVRRLLLGEGVTLAFVGGVLGAVGGLAYARAMLHGLTTIWRDAVGASALSFHATTQTLLIGLFAATAVGAITIWLALRKFVRRSARELLVGETEVEEFRVRSLKSKVIAVGALLAGVALAGWAVVTGDTANAGAFFGAGALVLIAGLAVVNARLVGLGGSNVLTLTPALSPGEREHYAASSGRGETADRSSPPGPSEIGRPLFPLPAGEGQGEGGRREMFSLSALGLRGCARRRTRSLATIAMLACGSFLIVSIGVFRLDANRDASKRTSGTGGFALIGETTMPVVHDLNTESGRDFFALSQRDLEGVSFVPFRVREGDEASCLNLNRAQKPRLLGVKPELLDRRFSFAKGENWNSLINTRLQPGESNAPGSGNRLSGLPASQPGNTGLKPGANEIEIPAIGDANSIQWAMHKKVGDAIDYVDERGQPFKVRIVGAVANSIVQGQLLIDEAEFVKRFPGESGYRVFLMDAPSNRVAEVSATLSRAMQDVGLEWTPAATRLAQFNAVQNTYLGTFQVLGGLGLLLGSVGLGIVVLRNVLERRGELAVLLAVGFRQPTLQRLLLIENGALLVLGLALGVVAAAVAVLPALLSPAAQLPVASLALTLSAVLMNGALWTWAATWFALRGNLLTALRNE